MIRIACLGECMLELSLAGGKTQFGFGGDTLNTAAYLARELEGSDAAVQYITGLGTDPFSDEMLAAWRREGIDTSLVARFADALPGLYLIRTDEAGERSFYYWREQAAVRRLFDSAGEAPGEGIERLAASLEGTTALYLSGITLAIFRGERAERLLEFLRLVRDRGVAVAFDTNYRARLWNDVAEARAAYARLAPALDIALPGFDDEHEVNGDDTPETTLERWFGAGVREVVVRQGPEAAIAAVRSGAGDETYRVAPPARCEPIDTTAAGDAFNAAYLAARLGGQAVDTAMMAGHVLAAHVIMHAGAIVPRK
ncbi:MAG: sugar kinase [Gammaproteobacteria bacterium]